MTMPVVVRQFVKFTGVGGVSAIGHYGTLIGLVDGCGVAAVPASALGALIGALINYSLNHRFTFRSTQRHRDTVLKFAVVAGVGLLLNTLFMWTAVDLLALHYLLGQVVTTVLVMFWSFLGNRYWTFHADAGAASPSGRGA